MFFLLFLLNGRRIRIRISDLWIRMWIQEAQKHMDPTDPDPQHWVTVKVSQKSAKWLILFFFLSVKILTG
jgi:hypothetical protein